LDGYLEKMEQDLYFVGYLSWKYKNGINPKI